MILLGWLRVKRKQMRVYEEDKNGLGRLSGELGPEWVKMELNCFVHVVDWISTPAWDSLLLFSLRGI